MKKENICLPICGACLGSEDLVTAMWDKNYWLKNLIILIIVLFLNLDKNVLRRNCLLRQRFTKNGIYQLRFYHFFYFNN